MSIQIKKFQAGRRRFIKTSALHDAGNWLSALADLKRFIAHESALQVVGHKLYLEVSRSSPEVYLLLEVVGLPYGQVASAPVLVDRESCEILAHQLKGEDLFHLDWDELLRRGASLHESLGVKLKATGVVLCDVFHFVYEQEKIELHFFSQKDYIQNQF